MTFWKVYSKARSNRVAIEGMFQDCHGFLVGSSPQLLSLDLRLLKLQGVWSMGINNAAAIVPVQSFICLDRVECFSSNIFTDPKILKLINYNRHDECVNGIRVCDFPNTLFYDMLDSSEMMMSEFCRVEGPLPYWRNTFFTALAAMYQLGFRTINLIGCSFNIDEKGTYAYEHDLNEADVAFNQRTYSSAVEIMTDLVPKLEDEGVKVNICHLDSKLVGICPYISFEEAVSKAVCKVTEIGFTLPKHTNDFKR